MINLIKQNLLGLWPMLDLVGLRWPVLDLGGPSVLVVSSSLEYLFYNLPGFHWPRWPSWVIVGLEDVQVL
jgi:hypothetical protein